MTDASAPGKLVLVGEYAVLDGAPAIVAAIDVRARAKVVAIPGTESIFFDAASGRAFYFDIDSSTGLRWIGECPEANGAILESVITSCIEHTTLFDDGPSFRVSMDTDDFFTHLGGRWTKLGIGSSAAVLVALVGALVTELNLIMPPDELLAVCHSAHRRFQGGRGSGADVATAVYGGVITVRRSAGPETVSATACDWPSGLLALPIWSGVSASTPEMLVRFDKFRSDNPVDYRRHLRRLKALSEQASVAWAEQSLIDILNTLADYADALHVLDNDAQIGINSEPHVRIRQLVERHGAVYKTSGAGGGDFGLALTDSTEVLEAVRADCLSGGFELLDKSFAVEGLAVS
jgi:ERG8-type phosphomevalonate kinase